MNRLPEIIGLGGTNGAGKDELGDLRLKHQGARKVSLSDILRLEADKRGLSHERANLGAISGEWGAKLGAGALSTMTIAEFQATRLETESGLSIVSVRRPEEAKVIQSFGGMILWIDADPALRYERILGREGARPTDQKTFEEFQAEEDREMHPADSDNPFALNMAGVRELADLHILNEFDSVDEYQKYLIDRFGLSS